MRRRGLVAHREVQAEAMEREVAAEADSGGERKRQGALGPGAGGKVEDGDRHQAQVAHVGCGERQHALVADQTPVDPSLAAQPAAVPQFQSALLIIFYCFAGVAIILVIWQVYVSAFGVSRIVLPGPLEILQASIGNWSILLKESWPTCLESVLVVPGLVRQADEGVDHRGGREAARRTRRDGGAGALIAGLRTPPAARLRFHQVGQPPGPRYLWPREQVFQPPRLAMGMGGSLVPRPGRVDTCDGDSGSAPGGLVVALLSVDSPCFRCSLLGAPCAP